MTPAARLQSAIDILDTILAGKPAEQALTNWARGNRFAGSKDRAAIRDHVFDCLRCLRSYAHLGGRQDGRGLVLGLLRATGTDPATLFAGAGYGPPALTDADLPTTTPMPRATALDCPDWLLPLMDRSLGAEAEPALRALRERAPVFLRVNIARTDIPQAAALLAEDGVETQLVPLADTALQVTGGARKIRQSRTFQTGLVELQDAASQAVIAVLPALEGAQVMDYCAGGGGKALAMAARGAHVTAHDANPRRMADIPIRAARAQARITVHHQPHGLFDLVLTDVPCSGSGAWRRAPEGKWALTHAELTRLQGLQSDILASAWHHVRPGGWLAYATCSLLDIENTAPVNAFVSGQPKASLHSTRSYLPSDGGDGFFHALIQKLI